ncbi:hypothetical protein JRQ81_008351 [Phrynocephalus forsythii]|uniref:Uncharacterized protein n=1 Tax=Phrynocephalus forsythii TaxID=171643 RepID=A0A9Q0XCL5_9SAUR|nr:hypothetical protein JRQ81_008351 [Phrynocephalus forsythii]
MAKCSGVQAESPESPQRGETPKTEKQRARPERRLYPVGFTKPVYPLYNTSRFGRAFEDLEPSDLEPSAENSLSSNDIFLFTGKQPSYAPKKPTRSSHNAEDTLYWGDDDLQCDCPHGIKKGLQDKEKEKSMTSELEMVSEYEGYQSLNRRYQEGLVYEEEDYQQN